MIVQRALQTECTTSTPTVLTLITSMQRKIETSDAFDKIMTAQSLNLKCTTGRWSYRVWNGLVNYGICKSQIGCTYVQFFAGIVQQLAVGSFETTANHCQHGKHMQMNAEIFLEHPHTPPSSGWRLNGVVVNERNAIRNKFWESHARLAHLSRAGCSV